MEGSLNYKKHEGILIQVTMPLFSVIIPCYNRATLIERTVESVRRQTYTSFEIIIVDDASTDTSVDVVKARYHDDPRVQLIEKKENGGVHTARNAGLDIAQGEYILFLDSDDELYPEALTKLAQVLHRDATIAIVSGPYKDDAGELTGLTLGVSDYVPYEDLLTMRVSRANKAGVSGLRRSMIGPIRFVAPNLDYIFYRYLMRKGRTYYIAQPLGIYHKVVAAGSLNYERKLPKPHLSVRRAKAIDAFLIDFEDDLLKHHPKLFAGYAYSAAVGLLLAGDLTRARLRSRQALISSGGKLAYVAFMFLTYVPYAQQLLWLFFKLKIRYTMLRTAK
jgi:teichuronic acid biosynthesis glycosyltransferase TuaG